MTVNNDSDFARILSDVVNFKSSLISLGSNYNEGVASASTLSKSTLDSLYNGGWNDDVSAQVVHYAESLDQGIISIRDDLGGGGFASLTNLTDMLIATLSDCDKCRRTLEDEKSRYVPQTVVIDRGLPTERVVPNTRALNEKAYRIASYEKSLSVFVGDCNNILSTLSGVVFNASAIPPMVTSSGSFEALPLEVAGEDLSEVAAMASGLLPPTNETVDSSVTNNGDTDQDGLDNYTENRHTEQEFEGQNGGRATRTEDLRIDGETVPGQNGADSTNIPEHGTGTAHYETSDGGQYTGDITVDYTHQGAAYQKNETITSDADGSEVAKVGTHQVMEYNDSTTGSTVNVTDRRIDQGDVVVETRNTTYNSGDDTLYSQSSTWSYRKPAEGQPIMEGTYVADDGGVTHTYTYAFNEQGQLIETDSYYNPGGLFGFGKGEHNDTRVVDTSDVYTLRVTNPDGSVTNTPVIMDSQLGFAEVARQYENARLDVGMSADHARDGIHHLTLGDGQMEVASPSNNGQGSYTFELIPPGN